MHVLRTVLFLFALVSIAQPAAAFEFNAKGGTDYTTSDSAFKAEHDRTNDTLELKAAPSGTAGNPITWTDAVTVDTGANVGVQQAAPKAPLHVGGEAIIGETTGLNCDADREGGIRYSSTAKTIEMCDGTEWKKIVASSDTGDPSTPNPSTGYFVVTSGTWDGDLKTAGGAADGHEGADALCLSDLTANDWMNKADAQARGLLVAGKIKAFICPTGIKSSSCNSTALPNQLYTLAVSGDATKGGATFTADGSGQGPGNTQAWSGTNYFDGMKEYWSGNRDRDSSSLWRNISKPQSINSCSAFTDGTNAEFAFVGRSSETGDGRWRKQQLACDQLKHLVCFVHP